MLYNIVLISLVTVSVTLIGLILIQHGKGAEAGAAFGGGGGNSSGIAVAHESLMMASDVTLLEQAARANFGNNTLANSAGYKKYASRFPSKTSIISFSKQEAQIKAMYGMFRTGGFPLAPNGIDFSKLYTLFSIHTLWIS